MFSNSCPPPMIPRAETLAATGLETAGHLALGPEDGLPARYRSLLLLSPAEPAFWPLFEASPEARDDAPDPLDRWSARVIGALAQSHDALALFPFGGPPWHPFIGWAQRTGRVHPSPVALLVHDRAGLFVSFRGALAVTEALDPDPRPSPCLTCAGQPCRTACPVGALTPRGYDTAACHAFLDRPAGRDCLARGCAVRRACPVGADRRAEAQSAFHMAAFHP